MAVGHITLGAVGGTARNYSIADEGRAYMRESANPFAARINTNEKWGDLTGWNEWVMDTWETGIGHTDPEEGLVWATVDTVVPGQLILSATPQLIDARAATDSVADCRNMPRQGHGVTGALTIGSGQTNTKLAIKLTPDATTQKLYSVYFLIKTPTKDVAVKGSLYSDNSGPDSVLDTGVSTTFQTDSFASANYHWVRVSFTGTALTSGSTYWIVVEPNDSSKTLSIATTTTYTKAAALGYQTTTWTALTGNSYMVYCTGAYLGSIVQFYGGISFNSTVYAVSPTTLKMYKISTSTGLWVEVGSLGSFTLANRYACAVFNKLLYFPSCSTYYKTIDASDTIANVDTPADMFYAYNGYLWRTDDGDLFYTGDGTTWTQVETPGDTIWGMVGHGDKLLFYTDRDLFYVAPGDFVQHITKFPSPIISSTLAGSHAYKTATNGTDTYIILNEEIYHINALFSITRIWPNERQSVSAEGANLLPCCLTRTSSGIMCWFAKQYAETLWATSKGLRGGCLLEWSGGAWHCKADTVNSPTSFRSFIIFDGNAIYCHGGIGYFWKYDVAQGYTNPYYDPSFQFAPYGWVETEKFFGGPRELDKDWESVYIAGENISAAASVYVYWQDSGSTAWELLGTVDSNEKELRWSTYSTRPNSPWIKIGLLLYSNDTAKTPRVQAVRVKFHTNVTDRWRWQVGLDVYDNVQLIDGALNTRTGAQMSSDLASAIQSVPPVILTDIDGTKYEVKVINAVARPIQVEYYNSGKKVQWRYDLTLEQVTDSTYSA